MQSLARTEPVALGTRPPRRDAVAPTRRSPSYRAMLICAVLVPLGATAAAFAVDASGVESYALGFVSGLYVMLLAGAFLRWRESR